MKSYKRSERVKDLILRESALCLQREIHDPRLKSVSLVEVELNSDMSKATIYFTAIDTSAIDEIAVVLNKAAGFIKHHCSQVLDLRYMPSLSFVYDASIISGANLSKLLHDLPEPEQDDEHVDKEDNPDR